MALFPVPAHRTGRADLPHPALGESSRFRPRKVSGSFGETDQAMHLVERHPFPSRPTPSLWTRGEPAIFKVAVETRRPSCRREQQAGFAAVVVAEELRNLRVQVDASSSRCLYFFGSRMISRASRVPSTSRISERSLYPCITFSSPPNIFCSKASALS